jgi:DNA-directed RNA polymerase specialized sigma24 family protein
MLFQRILSNCTLDWFRRQKTRKALFSNLSDFESASEDGDFDLLETYEGPKAHSRRRAQRTRPSGLRSCERSKRKSRPCPRVNAKHS